MNVISERISDDKPPQMKILNMVIPILMHFCSFISNWSVASCIKPNVIQRFETKLMTSNYFRQYIAGYTVTNFCRYPIRCIDTKESALECPFTVPCIVKSCMKNVGQYLKVPSISLPSNDHPPRSVVV